MNDASHFLSGRIIIIEALVVKCNCLQFVYLIVIARFLSGSMRGAKKCSAISENFPYDLNSGKGYLSLNVFLYSLIRESLAFKGKRKKSVFFSGGVIFRESMVSPS